MTGDSATEADELERRIEEIRDDSPGAWSTKDPEIEPYEELLEDDYEPVEILRAIKDGGFGTEEAHRHMDILLLAVIDDEDLNQEFLGQDRWYA